MVYSSLAVKAMWRSPSKVLTMRVDQIECGLRLMVSVLAARARQAQEKFVRDVEAEWESKEVVKAAMEAKMNGMVGGGGRQSSAAEHFGGCFDVTNVYQAVLFLEAVGNFLVGFRDEILLAEYEDCEKPINSTNSSTISF